MIGFIIGAILGSIVTVITLACCKVAGDADEADEHARRKEGDAHGLEE